MKTISEGRTYSIPNEVLERLLLNCATLNNCLNKDDTIKEGCLCYNDLLKAEKENETK